MERLTTKEKNFSTFHAVARIAHTASRPHHWGMSALFSRGLPAQAGSSVLAALLLVGLLGFALFTVEIFSPQRSLSLAAASEAAFVSASPKDCNEAINRALNKAYDPGVTSTDKGQSGTLDTCFGAVSKTGKPSAKTTDYTCVGRSGTVLFANGAVSSNTIADASVEKGSCKVDVCNGDLQHCSAAKLYKGGITASNARGVVAGTQLPTTNFVPSYAGGDAYGTGSITGSFGPGTNTGSAFDIGAAPMTGVAPNPFGPTSVSGMCPNGDCSGYNVDPNLNTFGSGAEPLPYAPTDGSVTGAGLDCANDNCATLKPNQGEVPGTGDPSGGTQTAPAQGSCPFGQVWMSSGCYTYKDGTYTRTGAETAPCAPGQIKGPDGRCVSSSTFQPPPSNPGPTAPPPSGSNSGLNSLLQSMLQGLAKGLGASTPSNAPACSSDPNAYAQQQQQYNQQLQQYNSALQQYNYQQQMSQLNGLPAPVPPVPPQQCQQTSSSNTCPTAPAQPPATSCPNGTWKPVTTQQSNGYQCTNSWQCVAGGSVVPTAQISCQPQVADVGMSVAISYSCGNATGSTGQGFDTQNQTSGSTTTVITTPPAGATGANYLLNCTNQGASAQAQCSVQIGNPSIVLVANPKVVDPGSASTIGWVTSGMQSCVISSPELPDFTAANANNTSPSGMASTTPLSTPVHILLHCVTVGGGIRDATTTVGVVGQPDPDVPPAGTISVQSSADGGSVARGSTVDVSWSTINPPSGAKVALWLFDVALNSTTARIQTALAASSTYAWHLPNASDTCDAASINVCASDLVPGRSYGIEAALYTDTSNPDNPSYIDYGFTPTAFTISQ